VQLDCWATNRGLFETVMVKVMGGEMVERMHSISSNELSYRCRHQAALKTSRKIHAKTSAQEQREETRSNGSS